MVRIVLKDNPLCYNLQRHGWPVGSRLPQALVCRPHGRTDDRDRTIYRNYEYITPCRTLFRFIGSNVENSFEWLQGPKSETCHHVR